MLSLPQLPAASVPPLDWRGQEDAINLTLPPVLSRAHWLFLNDVSSALASLGGSLDTLTGSAMRGTHGARTTLAPSSLPDGALFVETDRNGLVYQVQAGVWMYVSGTYQRTQAQLAALIATLTTADIGMRIYVTDYVHVLWCSAATTVGWAPEDDHRAGEISHFDVDPGTGWKLLNGNGDDGNAIGGAHPIAILKSDGTTRANTTAAAQNAGVYLRGAAAYNGAVTAPTVPTISTPTITVNNATLSQSGFTAGAVSADVTATHNHTATSTTPTATLPGDPVSFSDALPYIRK